MSRIVVTGAAGFVGRAVVGRLLSEGHEVVACVRTSGTASRHARCIESVTGDLISFADWDRLLTGAEAVVHLAARVHQMQEDPATAERAHRAANTDLTLRLATAAAACGVRRFLFVSSIKVNGEGGDAVLHASDPPSPSDAYARSKLAAEEGLRALTATGPMTHTILRPPLMYGPGVKANLYRLLAWVERGRPWPFGAMTNRRSLLFVGNMADAITTAVASDAAAQQTYLLSDGAPVSTADILRAIATAMERPIAMAPLSGTLTAAALRLTGRDDLARRLFGSLVVDDAPFRDDTGWTPPFSLPQGMKTTVDWYLQEGR